MPDEDPILAIASAVEAYLAAHPEAADSAEGILRWWLPRVRLEESVADVQRALDLLVERGAVESRQVAGGRVVYRLVHDRPRGDG